MTHRAGNKIIATVAFIPLLFSTFAIVFIKNAIVTSVVSIVTLLLFVFVLRFFRIPKRTVKYEKGKIIAPADGQVVTIERVFEPEFLNREALQISIFMSVWNVHINWFPVKGTMKKFVYHPGKFLLARHPKSSELNERTSVLVESETGSEIVVRQIAGIVARRVINYVQTGNTPVEAGQEMGFIKFGSRVDLFLPVDTEVNVKIGQKVKGLETLIATEK